MSLYHHNVCNRGFPPLRRLTQLAVFLSTLSIAASAHAAYYVATSGSDSNPGTEAAPPRTIAKASQRLAAGDTLFIRAGTYAESINDGILGFVFRDGTSSADTRYAAYPGEERKVTLNPPKEGYVYALRSC